MKALVVGPGKMGRAIEAVLIQRGHAVRSRVGRHDSLDAVDAAGVDLAFEFTTPSAGPGLVEALLRKGIPVVSGTTGWDTSLARELATRLGVAFLHSPNFSVGVAAVRRAAMVLGGVLARFPEFEPGILERHHKAKKDAPSGTARAIAAAVAVGRPGGSADDVPVVSLRHGGQPGEHVLFFEGPDEAIELVHRARSRGIFAAGAVQAGEWLLSSGVRGPATFDDFFERRAP